MPASAPLGHLLPREGGRIPIHRLLIQMAFDTRMPLPRIRHFERKREIFFVRGKATDVRGTTSGKHRTPCAPEERCFMQTDSRMKQKMANEKDPSAALGMTIRANAPPPHDFSVLCDANLRPFGAPPSMGRRENAASRAPHEDGFRYENAASPHSSFRAKARNLFRSRSRKDVRGAGNEKPSAPCAPKKRCFMQAVPCRKMKGKSISNRR